MHVSGDVHESSSAARQAAIIFVVGGLFTLTALLSDPISRGGVLAVAAAHLAMAGFAWFGPWERWGLASVLPLALVAIILLSAAVWVFDGFASGIGPMYVLVFAWLGLHFPWQVTIGAAPVAAIGYAGALLAVDARPRLVASTLVLVPIAVTVSLMISRSVGKLRQTQRDLEVKERLRAALMATLAHDVRSPLSSVLGTLEILEDDPRHEAVLPRAAGSATRQTNRVVRLATGILEVERVEQGKLRLDTAEVHLAELARQVAELTRPGDVEVAVEPAMVMHGDPQRLEQILYNLTNNALRHGEPPVVIDALARDAVVELTVRDHGRGVGQRDVANLFDRFSSADHSPQSVGLGLWIVQLLAESHGGSVHYEPADPGARFVVTLPRAADGSARPSVAATRSLRLSRPVQLELGLDPGEQLAGHHDPLHLVGALVDLGDLGVAHHPLDRVVAGVAVAAEHLDGVGGDLHRDVGGEALRGGAEERQVLVAALGAAGGGVRHLAGGLDLHAHVGEQELQALEVRDRLAELLALLGVAERVVERALGDADRLRGDGDAGVVEGLHRGLEAGALGADHPVGGDPHVVEVDLAGRASP